MALTASGQNLAVGGITGTIDYLGLADASGTEVTGGSPAYARKSVTWNAAASGKATSSNAQAFDVPAGTTVCRILLRADLSGGTDYGWCPTGGHVPFAATVANSGDILTSYAHGLADTQRVYLAGVQGGSVPSGLSAATLYYVVSATTDTFQVSATQGGAAVTISADGEVIVQRCTPETFGGQGTYTIGAGDMTVDATLL